MRRPLCILVLCLLVSPHASAGIYDIALRGVGRPQSIAADDPAYLRYQALTCELMLALMPRPLQTAETLGASGFEFSLASTISAIHANADFWRGQPGAPVLNTRQIPGALWTPVLRFAKGLPWSSQIGVFGSSLPHSSMGVVGFDLKIAVHESYVPWLPALAARLAAHRLLGAADIDAIGGEANGLLSLPIALPGVGRLTPFVGYSAYFVQVNAGIIDDTPFAVTDPINDQLGGARAHFIRCSRLTGNRILCGGAWQAYACRWPWSPSFMRLTCLGMAKAPTVSGRTR